MKLNYTTESARKAERLAWSILQELEKKPDYRTLNNQYYTALHVWSELSSMAETPGWFEEFGYLNSRTTNRQIARLLQKANK